MLPDRVSNPGPLTYESGALPIALRGPAVYKENEQKIAINPIAVKMAEPLQSFGHSECNRVKDQNSHPITPLLSTTL